MALVDMGELDQRTWVAISSRAHALPEEFSGGLTEAERTEGRVPRVIVEGSIIYPKSSTKVN